MSELSCQLLYDIALNTRGTGDDTKWPDVLAYRHPVEDIATFTRLIGFDPDLAETVTNVVTRMGAHPNTEDQQIAKNVLEAAVEEQARRVAATVIASASAPCPFVYTTEP